MIIFIKCIKKGGLINSESNLFGQELSECATLKSRRKCTDMGLEMVDLNLKWNLGVCLGTTRIKDGAEETGNDASSKILVEQIGFKHN